MANRLVNKILLMMFTVLLLILVGELIFLYKTAHTKSTKTVLNQVKKLTKSPTPTLDWLNPKQIDFNYRTIAPYLAIDPKVIASLQFYKKGLLQTSVINNTFKGKIIELDTKGGKAFYDYYDYKLKLTISIETNQNIFQTFYFSEDDLSKTAFLKSENNREKQMQLRELKTGDIIIVEESVDATKMIPLPTPKLGFGYLTKSWGYNRNSVKIIKIN